MCEDAISSWSSRTRPICLLIDPRHRDGSTRGRIQRIRGRSSWTLMALTRRCRFQEATDPSCECMRIERLDKIVVRACVQGLFNRMLCSISVTPVNRGVPCAVGIEASPNASGSSVVSRRETASFLADRQEPFTRQDRHLSQLPRSRRWGDRNWRCTSRVLPVHLLQGTGHAYPNPACLPTMKVRFRQELVNRLHDPFRGKRLQDIFRGSEIGSFCHRFGT
jgi:hypothetical protein